MTLTFSSQSSGFLGSQAMFGGQKVERQASIIEGVLELQGSQAEVHI